MTRRTKRPHLCQSCGADIFNLLKSAKYCRDCSDERKREYQRKPEVIAKRREYQREKQILRLREKIARLEAL